MPAAETSSRKMSSLHPLVKVLRNYTVTNPQDICGRDHGCHTCSSHTLARQMGALKNWCRQQLLNTRSIRNRGTHGIIQPLPWPATPFHTWLLHCFQRRLQLSSARTYTNPRHRHRHRHRHLQQDKHLPTLERFLLRHSLWGAETSAGGGKVIAHPSSFC